MKKIVVLLLSLILTQNVMFADSNDKFTKEALQSKNHFSIFRPTVEGFVERSIRKALKKETGAKFDVKFEGYTVSSMKKGIFKSLELTANDVVTDNIPIPYVHLKSLTDYNYIEYEKDPMVFRSDMVFAYDILLSEETINTALQDAQYQKVINSVNKLSGPLFFVKNVRTKIVNGQTYILMDYNFPINKLSKDKTFVMLTDFAVENGKIKAKNVKIDSAYGNIGLTKVANLINLLNPLEFTLDILDSKKCDANIENVKIIDNRIKVDGKINIKGEG